MTNTAASVVNLLGFITGIVLYAMLLWMVLGSRPSSNRLLLLTGLFGLAWNVGGLGGYGLFNLGVVKPAPVLLAGAFGALCFLPAVVFHSAFETGGALSRRWRPLVAASAYTMSGAATTMHFHSAIVNGFAPSQFALRGVTLGFGALLVLLLVVTRGHQERGRVLWVVAMAVFAVSAIHLSNHQGEDPWWLELGGHHASLPLVLLILYQDFRFALADIFLKRALAFMLLAMLAFGVFVYGVTPLVAAHRESERNALLLGLWIATAIAYPSLRRTAEWFVDNVILHRADYGRLVADLSEKIDRCDSATAVLQEASRVLGVALNSELVEWSESNEGASHTWVQQDRRRARVRVPTTDKPQYILSFDHLTGGRRLLSDDIGMLERSALIVARRIDAVRFLQERYQRDLQEQEMRKLAAEAELRALRAQINPHFLFNALTTIGFLIQTAPDRALQTLLRLSELLRGVLRSGDELVTLNEELDLIGAYLDIERARYEHRLRVSIDVPSELRDIRIPALIIQPLVENAIKHGISPCITGGEVRILARLSNEGDASPSSLCLSVVDTGVGSTPSNIERGRRRGHGLTNVERRLRHYGGENTLEISSAPGAGTTVEIRLFTQRFDPAVRSRSEAGVGVSLKTQ